MRILWSSDQHTLHQVTPTKHILSNLSRFLWQEHNPEQTDMYLFGGDFMERQVETPNEEFVEVMAWGKDFLQRVYDANKDAVVIWLEGTSSHDWEQPQHFLNVAPRGLDVRWVKTLCIQKFEQFDDLTIMFVPDNMGKLTPDEIWDMALKTLADAGLKKVDLIAFHGGFDFQLHAKAQKHAHILERWKSIVKFAIFSGHIHKPVQGDKHCSSGSFDRTAHGEEHPKGGYVVELDKKKNLFNPQFWENKRALPFLTIHVTEDVTAEALIQLVHEFIKLKKPMVNSQLRIKGGDSRVVNPILDMFKKDYPLYGWKAENAEAKDAIVEEQLFDAKVYKGVSLTKDNIEPSLFKDLEPKLISLNVSREEGVAVLKEFL